MRKTLWAVMFACASLTAVHAQDPLKIAPKHYSLAFENEEVQVLNVHYAPHEKSALHDHPGGVVVILTGGHLKFTDQNGNVRDVYAKAGESRWFPAMKHSVENVGDTVCNSIYIGIKSKSEAAQKFNDEQPNFDALKLDAQTRQMIAGLISAASKQ